MRRKTKLHGAEAVCRPDGQNVSYLKGSSQTPLFKIYPEKMQSISHLSPQDVL
jgi:hypothetical protein